MTAQFDAYADTYRTEVERAISFGPQGLDFYTEAKARYLVELVRRHLGDPARVSALDVGCGVGLAHRFLQPSLGALHGVDVSTGAIEIARRANADVRYSVYDGAVLPFPDESFDVAFAVCVLHHVPLEIWQSFAAEMTRVVRPGGLVAVVEHNPLNPLTRLVVRRCAFDQGATLLSRSRLARLLTGAGLEPAESRHILFFPWRGRAFERADRLLGRLPLGAQHIVAARRRHG